MAIDIQGFRHSIKGACASLFLAALIIAVRSDYIYSISSGGQLGISELSFDFGLMPDTGFIAHTFIISNVGRGPLTIKNASPSCGCTIVRLEKKLLEPDASTKLVALLSLQGKSAGPIVKNITLTTSDEQNPVTILKMHGNLWQVPTTGHPMIKEGIFKGSCASCHADKGAGKMGAMLYSADCAICHNPGHDLTAIDLTKAKWIGDSRALPIIVHGLNPTNMPAFSRAEGGPLSDAQISSLISYLRGIHPN